QYRWKLDTPHLLKLASSKELDKSVRRRALASAILAATDEVWAVCMKLTDDPGEPLAGAALKHLAAHRPTLTIPRINSFLNSKSIH
ncbi:MAG: hypothetical protein QF886_27475, partial [Planctomycetota bacterium]|nr:hypothetical protein [Planctomycetota bacterium]